MIIRPAKTEDQDKIISVLKAGLGEVSSQKNRTVWQYKHVDNPFGQSIVLIAEENDRPAGVRAFMSWRWQLGNDIWQAYRAVDTATHPDFQRRGIFKTLTLQALEKARHLSDCFVFNTPNKQSRPGYLKMGWQMVDSLKVALVPSLFQFGLTLKKNTYQPDDSTLQTLCELHNSRLAKTNQLFTPKSPAYLKWRYLNNPMQAYEVINTKDFFIALYVKKHGFFKELRVAELIKKDGPKINQQIKRLIAQKAFKNQCLVISLADPDLFKCSFYGNFGPILTVNPLTENQLLLSKIFQLKHWHYSLGDLELF